MTREDHIKVQMALRDARWEAATTDLSDITSADDRQGVTAAKYREIASEKILALDGLTWEDVREDYKREALRTRGRGGDDTEVGA